jgi:prephenate dehydrogenase
MVGSVLIIGLGLIGGSLASALRRVEGAPLVFGVDVDAGSVALALSAGLVEDAVTPDALAQRGWLAGSAVDLVVLATPVAATVEWLRTLADAGYGGIVTDVSSTKGAVVSAAESCGGAFRFVGGHPMAGSESSGLQAANPDLFKGAYYILTPDSSTDTAAYRSVHRLVTSVGARVISIDPAAHDRAVAVVSHVPHVAAAALVEIAHSRALESGDDVLRLAAGGFKDTTRIAAGSPELWAGICLDNAPAVRAGVEELERVLGGFRSALDTGDSEALRQWFASAADVRRALPAQWVPASTTLFELVVPVIDRPGMVSTVTMAVSSHGCNIEDIEIDHRSEDSAYLRLVLTDEGDHAGLVSALEAEGFAPVLRPLEGDV